MGVTLNSTIIDAAGGTTRTAASVDVSAGTQTLTDAQTAAPVLTLTGALSANAAITLPTTVRNQKIRNATTGSYTLTVQRGVGGVALGIPQNETIEVR